MFKEANEFKYNNINNTNEVLTLKNNINNALNNEELSELLDLYNNKELNRVIPYKETPLEIKTKLNNMLDSLTVSKNYAEISNLEANSMSSNYKNNIELANSKKGYTDMNIVMENSPAYNLQSSDTIVEKIYKDKILNGTINKNTSVQFNFSDSKYSIGSQITGIETINNIK